VYVYRSLIETYPGGKDAQAAQVALNRMPAWALAQPPSAKAAPLTTRPATPPSPGSFRP
jgi:hypothetical protein